MIFPDLSKKACKCCGGSARGFILFVSEEDNKSDKVNGIALHCVINALVVSLLPLQTNWNWITIRIRESFTLRM